MLARSEGAQGALVRTGDFIRTAAGWRRAAIAFGAGALSALAFAPYEIFPLFLIAVAVLVLLIDGAQETRHPMRSAAWVGWCWAFGQFLVGLYWVAYAFLVEAAAHAWQIPFVETFLPGGLALFIALACAIAARFWWPGASRIFVLAIAYGVAEWVRGHIFTGFPWNLPAYAWGASLGILQSTALFGSYGLSLLTVLFGASLAQFASRDARAWHLPAVLTLLFALFWIGGDIRLAITHPEDVRGVHLRLVQPNVPQREKILRRYWTRNWQELVSLSLTRTSTQPTIIVWPEAAPPYIFTRVQGAMDQIAALTDKNRILMTGAVRVFVKPDNRLGATNSLYIFGPGGVLLSTYDKFHLVPFGEYLPLAGLLERLGISQVVAVPEGFQAGDGPHTYDLPNAPPVGPLICYEIIFPGAVTGQRRPGWFVNVTDDSWFGPSSGPYQHLLTARVRAIEEGIPIARDANTGISAIIDPLGRVRARLGPGQSGVVDSPLPAAVPKTPFARFGEAGLVLLLLALCWGAGWNREKAEAKE
ncbi:MAG TPA: apolipoprotein N-acyltransferase [Rhizomicrobium sp.]|nr:apolipoprotein N-acyltransferase [Rhizomicrobium sp.]